MWRCPTYLHLKRWGFVCLISISKIEKEHFPGGKVDTVSNCYFFLSYNLQDLGYIKKGAWFKSILFKSSYHPHNLDLIPGATGRLKAPPPRPPAQRSREFLPSEREVPSLPLQGWERAQEPKVSLNYWFSVLVFDTEQEANQIFNVWCMIWDRGKEYLQRPLPLQFQSSKFKTNIYFLLKIHTTILCLCCCLLPSLVRYISLEKILLDERQHTI